MSQGHSDVSIELVFQQVKNWHISLTVPWTSMQGHCQIQRGYNGLFSIKVGMFPGDPLGTIIVRVIEKVIWKNFAWGQDGLNEDKWLNRTMDHNVAAEKEKENFLIYAAAFALL